MLRFQFLMMAILGVLLMQAVPALALTTEQAGDVIKGGSSNFSDPDEQMPAMVGSSSGQNYQQGRQSSSVTIDQNNQREQNLGLSQAFDRAYSNK